MRITIVSDAWRPQVNGVVRTLETTVSHLRARGHLVETITPEGFRTIPCPSYPEIRLAVGAARSVRQRLAAFAPEAVHIATEGPLGWAARRWCLAGDMPFSTSFHTRFPEYVALRTHLPSAWFWPVVRRFHGPAATVMAATDALAAELRAQGIGQTRRWSRGVDLALFAPDTPAFAPYRGMRRPIQLCVGRVAVEKNIEAFLSAPLGGTKVIVGDGPARAMLERRFPEARFLGALSGAPLAAAYAGADVLAFPSRTDTFGLVMIEALASGTPVAGYPVRGPLDIIGREGRGPQGRAGAPIGALDEDLGRAIAAALGADRAACAAEGRRYSWEASTDQFVAGLCPVATIRLAAAA